ncbi:IBR domain containing protein [Acanthamoeba castellanii str. Neff]|uniref:RBR-type E3 ubiquitin transferase n=1 Tax=Acanthamoeba castellanii (strain ATCC 30010 / Neff) TaxID=1257118 RepID=L8GXU9_ACACF|nr:IBR domain containing protein [Acanthamoeba castellanii str. Neff]ELR17388.1 IBR domain containing protein [Acanthamoeba castellanii str. Neff]
MRNLWHSTQATPAAPPCAPVAAPAPATEERLPDASATTTSTSTTSTAATPAPATEEDPLDAFMRRIEAQAARPSRWDDVPATTTRSELQPSRSRWDDTPTAPPARTNASRSLWDIQPPPPGFVRPPPGYIPLSARANMPPSNNPALAFMSRQSWQPPRRIPPSWLPGTPLAGAGRDREVVLGPDGQQLPEEPRPCAVCDLYIDFLEVESGGDDDDKLESEEKEEETEEKEKNEKANEEKNEGEEKRSEDDMEMENEGGEKANEKCNKEAEKKSEKNEWTHLPCQCKVCKECFSKYVSVRCASIGLTIFRANITPFACPSCGRGISTEAALANTTREVADRLDALALKHALSRMADLRFCPAPDCGNALWIDPATDHGPPGLAGQTRCVLKCDRDGCGTEFCFDCRAPWHEGMTCEESLQARESAEDAAAAAAVAMPLSSEASDDQSLAIVPTAAAPVVVSNRECKASLKVKACPQCGNETEKNGGCMHMTCVCGHEYCWECLSAVGDQHKEDCPSRPTPRAPLRLAPQAQKPPAVGATSRQPESQPARPRQPKSHNAAPSARGPRHQPKPQPEAEPAEAQTQPQPKPQPGERGPQPAQETP